MVKPNKPMCYAGYISPDGKLFSCPREGHRDLAADIVADYLHVESRNPEKHLDDSGWLKILSDGQLRTCCVESYTQKQLDLLGDLLACEFKDEKFIIRGGQYGDRYIHGTAKGWRTNIERAIWELRTIFRLREEVWNEQ